MAPAPAPRPEGTLELTADSTEARADQPTPLYALRCQRHLRASAIAMCTACSGYVCASCHRVDEHGLALCPQCTGEAPALEREPTAVGVPLEVADGRGLVARALETLKLALLAPTPFFQRVRDSERLLTPLIFCGFFMGLGLGMNRFWQMSLELPAFKLYMEMARKTAAEGPVEMTEGMMRAAYMMSVPFEAMFLFIFGVSMMHMGARLVGGSGGLKKTIQLFAYSSAAFIFALIPVAGGPIALAFLIFSWFAGLRALHDLSPGRAALVCAMPVFFSMLTLAPGG